MESAHGRPMNPFYGRNGKLARVLMCFDHIARFIVNPNHGIM
jgi:hypothetical protein